jgi:hypothetical protein
VADAARPFGPLGGDGLYGMPVHADKMFVVSRTEEVRRTWRERLFTLPWRPLRRTKRVVRLVPDPEVFMMDGKIFGHPATIDEFVRKANEQLRRKTRGGQE